MNPVPETPAGLRGSVISYDAVRGVGFIVDQFGRRFFFQSTDLEAAAPVVGLRVIFEPGGSRCWGGPRPVRHVAPAGREPARAPTSPRGLSPALHRRLAEALSRWESIEPRDSACATLDNGWPRRIPTRPPGSNIAV